jgi:hypothetical protein
LPSVPLPASRPGRPTTLAVDPPAGSGVTAAGLRELAADAVGRAYALANGERETGLDLSFDEDLARRAARLLEAGDLSDLAQAGAMPARELLWQALAWRDGGREGLAVLREDWDAPAEALAAGRAMLGTGARGRRNRVTLTERQLRLGRDGRGYPYRRSGRNGSVWQPDGPPHDP